VNLRLQSIWRGAAFAALACLTAAIGPSVAHAGTVILEGSDAIGYHCAGGDPDACTYRDQVWTAIGGSSPKPIAIIGNPSTVGSGTHAVQEYGTVSAAQTAGGGPGLNAFVALYLADGCCTENDSLVASPVDQTAILAYLSSGGTVMIENYTGGAAYDFMIGSGGNASNYVAGYGGVLGGPGCSDGESVNATGLLNGFTQPPVLSCWTHQAYDQTYFSTLGFNKSYFDSDPAFAATNPGYGPFSSLLANGDTQTGTENSTPEPAAFSMMGGGVLALALAKIRRRRAQLR
jgi:hypothetical protein